jgi:predicted lipoprotein with Yx(FWY)xxD motif
VKKKSKKVAFALALAAVLATLAIAGCGGGGSSSSSSEAGGGSGAEGTIAATEIEGLGSVLVDAEEMTVYDFTVDEGMKSNCYGGCEAAWPPVTTTGKPTAGAGATASDLGTTKRKDGTLQVTYRGHPLYTFAGDEGPGEATGNEAEGTWFVLDKKGAEIKGQPTGGEAAPAAAESSGGGY